MFTRQKIVFHKTATEKNRLNKSLPVGIIYGEQFVYTEAAYAINKIRFKLLNLWEKGPYFHRRRIIKAHKSTRRREKLKSHKIRVFAK